MDQMTFKAFVVSETENQFTRRIITKSIGDLPDHDTLIKVDYSSLNYKDALSSNGNRGVTKSYPHTPGVDAARRIVTSASDEFQENDPVIVTSYDLGMNTDGGFGQYIRVPREWVLKLPDGMSLKESMILGTAGLTAGMSVFKLTEQVTPDMGSIVVSGASGGVGAMTVSILAKLGYQVTAVSGKDHEHEFLKNLGAHQVISRYDFQKEEKRPMLKDRFAGGIDNVGGTILENIIKSTGQDGVVTCCGNVASPVLNITVFPFILRGVSLIGIDSQHASMSHREVIWKKLATDWKPKGITDMHKEISFDELNQHIDLILEGKLKGRTLLNLNR